MNIWVWLKIKEPGLCRFLSLVPFTKEPLWHIFLSHRHLTKTPMQIGRWGDTSLAHCGFKGQPSNIHDASFLVLKGLCQDSGLVGNHARNWGPPCPLDMFQNPSQKGNNRGGLGMLDLLVLSGE